MGDMYIAIAIRLEQRLQKIERRRTPNEELEYLRILLLDEIGDWKCILLSIGFKISDAKNITEDFLIKTIIENNRLIHTKYYEIVSKQLKNNDMDDCYRADTKKRLDEATNQAIKAIGKMREQSANPKDNRVSDFVNKAWIIRKKKDR